MIPRAGWLMVLAILVVIGLRTTLAARATLAPGRGAGTAHPAGGLDPLLVAAARQDSLLRGLNPNGRDPFRPWTPTGTVRVDPGGPARPTLVPLVPPHVVVFMQDGSSTLIQFEVDGETSPRLGIGGTFNGWTITGVTPEGVAVTKDGQSFNLRRP